MSNHGRWKSQASRFMNLEPLSLTAVKVINNAIETSEELKQQKRLKNNT
jgi:hypothetical protein